MRGHLSAGKEVGVSLDPCDDLTQDDTIREHVCLKTERRVKTLIMFKNGELPALL